MVINKTWNSDNMLNIILCDDDRFILNLAAEQIENEISKNHLDVLISCKTTESYEVFQYLKNNDGNYLIFLDLDFGHGKLNGIDVAKQVKSISSNAKVVFVTNHHEMAMQVLSSGVEPFGFLEKTTDMKQLNQGFAKYIQMAITIFAPSMYKSDRVELIVGIDEKVNIDKNQILYLESEKTISHGISYHTMDGSCITVRDTMEHCLEQLGNNYMRVHRSIIVNQKFIVALKGTIIRLANGEEIPCAVRMVNQVKKCLK